MMLRVCFGIAVLVGVYGCTTVPALPDTNDGVQFAFSTSSLKPRGALYPNESARFVVFRKADNMLLGGGNLKIGHSSAQVSLPANIPLLIRTFEGIPLFAASIGCNAETEITLSTDEAYQMTFEFNVNYDDHGASTCVSELHVMTRSGDVLKTVPIKATITSDKAPTLVPIPIG